MLPNQLNNLIFQQAGPSKPSSISSFGWGVLLGTIVLVDVAQLILDIFAIGLVANRFIDIGAGIGIALVLVLNQYRFDTNDLMVLIGSFIAEEIPGIDVAPFWTYDVWRFRRKDLARKKSAI